MLKLLKSGMLQLLHRLRNPAFRGRPNDVSQSYYRNGGLKPKPEQEPMALVLILVNVVPGVMLGTYAAKKLAYFLEVSDLFAPDLLDDDDDE